MKPVKILILVVVLVVSASIVVLTRKTNNDVLRGTWVGMDEDDVWTFYGGNFTRTWSDMVGVHTATGTYRIENGADLYFSGRDERGETFAGKYYFDIYEKTKMKLSSRWFKKEERNVPRLSARDVPFYLSLFDLEHHHGAGKDDRFDVIVAFLVLAFSDIFPVVSRAEDPAL